MVSLRIVGHCHTAGLETLARAMLPDAEIKTYDTSFPERQTEEMRKNFRGCLKGADFIISHALRYSFLDQVSLREEFGDKVFFMSTLYFRGLHPDSCYLGTVEDRFETPSLYHSVVVLDAFKRGLSKKQAVAAFDVDNFKRLGLLKAWDSSLDEMRRRDIAVDLSAADLVDSYCRQFPGFLTFNHPTVELLYLYLEQVFKRLGLTPRSVSLAAMKELFSAHDECPIFDFVAEHYGLPYRRTQNWMIFHMGKKFIDVEEYVHRCYEEYRKIEARRLAVHSPIDLLRNLQEKKGFQHLVGGENPSNGWLTRLFG